MDNSFNSNNPRVTIVIPCMNQGQYLLDAVASACVQTWSNLEIIVFDDGSTENYPRVVLEESGFLNKVILIESENKGLVNARNEMIAKATGELILPLDADDKIDKTYVEKAVPFFADQNVGIVYCRAHLFGEIDKPWELPPYKFPDILLGNLIFCSALFRKVDWEMCGGYDSTFAKGWEDYDLWLSIINQGRSVIQLEDTLFYYRQHSDSSSHRLDAEIKSELFLLLTEKHKKLYSDNLPYFLRAFLMQQSTIESYQRYIDYLRSYSQKLEEHIIMLEDKKEVVQSGF